MLLGPGVYTGLAGPFAGGAIVAGGAIRVAAGGVVSFDAVVVFEFGEWPMPKATARTTTTNTAPAIHPQAALAERAPPS